MVALVALGWFLAGVLGGVLLAVSVLVSAFRPAFFKVLEQVAAVYTRRRDLGSALAIRATIRLCLDAWPHDWPLGPPPPPERPGGEPPDDGNYASP